MNIAFILNSFPVLSETFIVNQIVALMDRGVDVEILAASSGGGGKSHALVRDRGLIDRTIYAQPEPGAGRVSWKRAGAATLRGLCQRPLPSLRAWLPTTMGTAGLRPGIIQRMKGFPSPGRYDAIHAHFATAGVVAEFARRCGFLKGPLITTFHGIDVNETPTPAQARRYRELFRSGDRFTANTNFTASQAEKLGCPREKVDILPVGLDPKRYAFQPRLMRGGERLELLSVARLVEKKGLEYGIRAVAKLRTKGVSVRYRIAGDGVLRSELERLINELGAEACVELLGWCDQDEVARLYEESHVFMLPSVTASNGDREGQGLVLQEAQAMGLPVISTLHNGIPEGVIDGETGLLVPEKDADALAGAIERLLKDNDRWPEIGRKGRELVEQHYDQRVLAEKLIKIYERVQSA